jgi:hypothetical protein
LNWNGLAALAMVMTISANGFAQEALPPLPPPVPVPVPVPAPAPPPAPMVLAPSYYWPAVVDDWQEGDPVPPGYQKEERRGRRGPIIGGAVTFGSLYMLTALAVSMTSDSDPTTQVLLVPVFGPLLRLADDKEGPEATILALDGLGQLTGLALLIAGLTSKRTVLVRREPAVRIEPRPLGVRGGAGVALGGTF